MADRQQVIARAIAHLKSGQSTAINPEGAASVLQQSQQEDGGGIRQFAAFTLAQRVLSRDGQDVS